MATTLSMARAASERSRQTRERLLDAAEALFAERGFEGTSLRAVTQAAGVSVSAANYHFGTKEALLHATLLRRVEPVNRMRLERLDALERAAEEPSLEAILETFLAPALEARAATADMPARYRQVAARLYSDPPELVTDLKRELFAPIQARYVAALGRSVRGAEEQALELAFQFTVGIMVHVLGGHLDTVPGMRPAADPAGALLERMVAFAAAGVRAAAGRELS